MKLSAVVLCCFLLAIASTEAKRKRRRSLSPKLRLTADPPVVIDGHTDELKVDCRVALGGGDVFPIYILLRRSNDNGTANLGLQTAERTDVLDGDDSRIEAKGGIASSEGDESFLTLTTSQPSKDEEGMYVCEYLYLTKDLNTITETVNVTLKSLPTGDEGVPPPVIVEPEGTCCEEAMEEIEKLKAALASSGGSGGAAAADGSCQAAFSAGLIEERGYQLRSSRTIIFDNLITNKGSAYDASTGKFTAPCDGQYYFSLTLGARHSTSGSVEGVIRRGTKNQARSFAFTSSYDDETSASTSVVLTLQKGEEVDVFLEATSDGDFIGGDRSTFSGYYLFP